MIRTWRSKLPRASYYDSRNRLQNGRNRMKSNFSYFISKSPAVKKSSITNTLAGLSRAAHSGKNFRFSRPTPDPRQKFYEFSDRNPTRPKIARKPESCPKARIGSDPSHFSGPKIRDFREFPSLKKAIYSFMKRISFLNAKI
jgi:hypothetical protein